MPRYLTPAKIHLLVLIDIHISGEIATSAHLHALNFIATRVVAPSDHEAASMRARYNIFEGSEVATLAEPLSRWPTYVPGRSTYDIFLLRMWDLISVDTLFDLFQHLCELSSSSASGREGSGAIKISRSSPIGQFVRRSCVEYTRLRFADAESLWRAVCASRSSSHSTWAQKNPSKVLAATGNGSNTPQQLFSQKVELFPSPVSDEDVGYLLNFSIHKLQKLGTRVPQLFRKQLDGWVSRETDSPAKSLQYFMAFFEHWRAGQHSAAIQSLHQYFDYYLNSKPASDNMKLYYQYALLHLSVLHADFAKWTDSVEALEECITTARENQDPACLSFALSWMLYLRQAHHQGQNSWSDCSESLKRLACLGGNDERDEIAFLKARAREGKNWALLSSTLLEEARVELGAKGSATKTAEHIVQASYFNTLHDLRSLLPASTLCSAACFNRLNFASLALCAYESVSVVHIDHAPLNDHVKAACRLAHAHALSGRHRAATDVLGSANSLVKGILKLEQKVQMFQMLIRVRFELQRANSEAAKSIFGVLQPSCASADPDVAFELILLEIEMLTMQHNYSSALRRVNAHVADLKTAGRDVSYRVQLLVVKSRIFAKANQPMKGFSLVLRAASTAERHGLVSALIEALRILGEILIELGEFNSAHTLLKAALPKALEGGDQGATASFYSSLAEASVGLAENDVSRRDNLLQRALANIDESYKLFEKVSNLHGQLQCLVMRGKIAAWEGDVVVYKRAKDLYAQLRATARDDHYAQ